MINSYEYNQEIKNIARSVVEDAMEIELDANTGFTDISSLAEMAMEHINDTLLHETIDSHQWVIYYAYNLDVIKHSCNDEYMIDNFGTDMAGELLSKGGINTLLGSMAFWAMYADVQELLKDKLDEKITSLEDAEDLIKT